MVPKWIDIAFHEIGEKNRMAWYKHRQEYEENETEIIIDKLWTKRTKKKKKGTKIFLF